MMTTHPTGWPVTPIALDGVRAFFSSRGTGPPLVLLPSLFALPRTYAAVADVLSRRFRVYLPEVPGSGRADRVRRPWPLDRYARWVGDFLTTLDLTAVTLVAHSHAGAVAVLAAAESDRVGRLVLADAVGSGERPSIAGGLRDVGIDIALVARAWHHVAFNLARHPRNFLFHVRTCFTANVLTRAARVDIPTIVGWGHRDHTLPLLHGRRYADAFPWGKLYVSEVGSHNWLITRPAEFAAVVNS